MQAWEQFLSKHLKDIGEENVHKWLRTLKTLKYDACNLYLEASDSFQANWFEEHIRPRLKSFVNNNNHPINVHLAVAGTTPAPAKIYTGMAAAAPILPDPLHPHFTFPFFSQTEENGMAFGLLSQIIGYDPKTQTVGQPEVSLAAFNPIYIYGGKGSGKTHLLMGAAQLFQSKGLHVFFVNAEKFTEHVVGAIRQSRMQEFRKAYRNIDILMLDDIHILARKAATQEEFFHTFNTLHTLGKQIILTANVAPKDLTEIEARLISRFEWGLTLHIDKKKENLRDILLMKAKAFQMVLPETVINLLLSSFGANAKNLCSALEALALRANMDNKSSQLTQSIAEKYLEDLLELEKKNASSPQTIVKAVSEHYSIRPGDILGKAQNREASLPRQVAMYFCRAHLKLPFMKIGEFFGRDHSTVMTSIKQVEKGLEENASGICIAVSAISKILETE